MYLKIIKIYSLLFFVSTITCIADKCSVDVVHPTTLLEICPAGEISKRRFSVPGPMVVTEFDPNSFPYTLQKRIEKEVNKIIDQEVDQALKQYGKSNIPKDFARFRPKERLWITLYYVGQIDDAHENLFIDALTDMQKHKMVTGPTLIVKLSDRIDFFGPIKELVIKIDDKKQSLTRLRADIKKTFIELNNKYKRLHNKQLYDTSFSEQYPFEPHITFGHISSSVAQFLEKHAIVTEKVMNNIFSRIKIELPSLLDLTDAQRILKIDTFQFNNSNRKVLKKFKLSKTSISEQSGHHIVSLPKPTGKYAVGTTIYHLTDPSRKERHAKDPNSHRELLVRMWYPAVTNNSAQFYEYASPEVIKTQQEYFSKELNIPLHNLDYLNTLTGHSHLNAQIAEGFWPVIIFSPGWGAPVNIYSSLLEDLASHGYVVVGINYPYVTNPVAFSGRVIYPQQESRDTEERRQNRDIEFNTWVADIQFVMRELQKINEKDPVLHDKLNMKQIGVMGHSFGGSAAIEVCSGDSLCKAGIDLDGKIHQASMHKQLKQPFMFVSASTHPEEKLKVVRDFVKNKKNMTYSELVDADHGSFTDIYLIVPWKKLPKLPAQQGINEIRQIVVSFFDKYLKKKPIDLNDLQKKYSERTVQT